MTRVRPLLALLIMAALVATLGAITASTAATASPSQSLSSSSVSLSTDTERPTAISRLTKREKRLAKAKRCGQRQWRRTPVRCQRIKAAKAKTARIAAIRKANGPKQPVVARPRPKPTTSSTPRPTPIPTPIPIPTPTPTPTPTLPPVGDSAPFTVAVYPDTQQEVFGSDTRIRDRSQWLVQQRSQLNLKFVTHIGDVVNWGWLDKRQYDIASAGMRPLEQAGIPYSLSLGNHDTGAVGHDNMPGRGYGGGAYVNNPECLERLGPTDCNTSKLVRRTTEFNEYFTAQRFGAVSGAFELGKVDNTYSTFAAGGRGWMVLNLELWPRVAAVNWARSVVAAHPRHNVIVSTHSYLDGDGAGIYGSAGYGSTSPRYLWENLVSQYANIKVVLSGHVGSGAVRLDTGDRGNRVVSLLQAFHSSEGNPVRLLRIDPASGTIETRVTSPNGRGGDFSRHTRTVDGLQFVG